MTVSLVVWTGIVACNSTQNTLPDNSRRSPDGLSQSSEITQLEQAIHEQINQYRTSRRFPPLTLDERISQQARQHSQAMSAGQVSLGHEGFEQRAERIRESISFQSIAENVAFNQGVNDPVRQAVQGWIESAGHRQNIEGNYTLTGVGVALNDRGEYFFTQLFVHP